jgi:hypothetical protein
LGIEERPRNFFGEVALHDDELLRRFVADRRESAACCSGPTDAAVFFRARAIRRREPTADLRGDMERLWGTGAA